MRSLVVGPAESEFAGTQRFEIIRRIGSGGMGVVYEAFDRERQSTVALKVLRSLDPETLFRFKNEFRVLQDIRHPNLIRLGELFEEEGRWFFTMEMVQGIHFLDYLEQTGPGPGSLVPSAISSAPSTPPPISPGPISPAPATSSSGRRRRSRLNAEIDEACLRDAFIQLARGLFALHRAKKVHRDIKPSNLLVTPDKRVVILDFGLAFDMENALPESFLVGTCWYMAPEQARMKPIGPAADWYSVGVLLYQALTGRLPVQGNAREVLFMKQMTEPPPPGALAIVPDDLNNLCVDLLRIEPKDRPDGREVLMRLGALSEKNLIELETYTANFVGRKEELRALRGAFTDACGKEGVTLFIHGESGVGKSALTKHFTEILAAEDKRVLVLSSRCYERESVPYKAVDGIMDVLSRVLAAMDTSESSRVLPAEPGLLGLVFPVMRKVEAVVYAPVPPVNALEPQTVRSRLFRAVRELFVRLSSSLPVVVLIDDLQWADADSLALLSEVMRPPDAPKLLLVCTLRAALRSEMSLLPGRGPRASALRGVREIERIFQGDVRSMRLDVLPPDEAVALVSALLGSSGKDAEGKAGALAQAAGGHPLFIDALVRETRATANASGHVRLEDALWTHIQALESKAHNVLDLLVIAGAPLPQQVAAQAAGLSFSDFSDVVELLCEQHLARTSGVHKEDTVEPYHDRVRETALLHPLSASETALHGRLASAFVALKSKDAEALAFHFRGAGELRKAGAYAEEAAEQAQQALAFERAARLYELSLELRPDADPQAQAALRLKLGDALANAGRGVDAAKAFLAAAPYQSGQQTLDLSRRAADQLLRSGYIDQALDAFRKVLDQIGMSMPATPISALLFLLLRRAQIRLRGLRFKERAETSIDSDLLLRIDTCWSVAAGLGLVDTIVGRYFQARCLLLALKSGELHRIARALAMEASYSSASGGRNRRRTAMLVRKTEDLAARLSHPYARGWARAADGISACLEGRWKHSFEACEEAEEIFRDECTGVYWEIGTVRWFGLWAQCYLGRLDALSTLIPERLREASERGDLYATIGHSTGLAGLIWLSSDQAGKARSQSQQTMERWSQKRFHVEHWWAMLGERQIDLYEGKGVFAYQRVNEQWSGLKSSLLLMVQLTKLEAVHLRARTALLAALEQPGKKRHYCRVALSDARTMEREKMPWSTPLAKLLRAAVAELRGRRDQALSLALHAEQGLGEANMAVYAAAARYRRGQLLGGDEGKELIQSAAAAMKERGIVAPERMVVVYAPGFGQ